MRIPFTADEPVSAAIRRLGRTEDVQWSPAGRRLALIAYDVNRVLILEADVDVDGDASRVELSGALEITSASFRHPHGVSWLDEDTLVVANREGAVGIFELPECRGASLCITLDPVRTIGTDRRDLVATPG